MTDRLRILITVARSGSTAFLRTFENNPFVHGYYQPIKSGFRETGELDYSIYEANHPLYRQYPDKFLVVKETLGPRANESKLNFFPTSKSIKESRPLFIFREPLVNYHSWKTILKTRENYQEHMSIELFNNFLASYEHNFDLFQKAVSISDYASCLTLEKMGENPSRSFQAICNRWDIPYSSKMLNWEIPWGENTSFWSEEVKLNLMGRKPRLIKMNEGIRCDHTFSYSPLKLEDLDLTEQEKESIKTRILPLYQEIVRLTRRYYAIKD